MEYPIKKNEYVKPTEICDWEFNVHSDKIVK